MEETKKSPNNKSDLTAGTADAWKRPPFVDWLKYECKLCTNISPLPSSARGGQPGLNVNAAEFIPMSARTPTQKLSAKISQLLLEDPYGIGSTIVPSSEWIAWAMKLAQNYPQRTECVLEECRNDWRANKYVLNSLRDETLDGFSGSMPYIHSLNYSLQDSFERCGLPLPPGIDLRSAIMGGETLYKSQMNAWMSYQSSVFRIVDAVNSCPINVDGSISLDKSLPDIKPSFQRRPMTTQVIQYLEFSGLNATRHNARSFCYIGNVACDEHDEFQYCNSIQCNYEEDFPSNYKFQRKSTDQLEPTDPFRYPKGVQFYTDGGYNHTNKYDGLRVTLVGEYECWNEAIPDICLRADEGDLEGVKRIVEAASLVSDLEKRAIVNKARRWTKYTFHQDAMPTVLERYDGTPLAHACINGHHDIVQYLLEQGADPTLYGAMFLLQREEGVARGRDLDKVTVNSRGAVHRFYGKIERGEIEVPPQGVSIMMKCGTRCEELLAAARPYWAPALYRSEDCEDNDRVSFDNVPCNIASLHQALMAVPAIDERPPKKICSLCCRKKSRYSVSNNGFPVHAVKCNLCSSTDNELLKKERTVA